MHMQSMTVRMQCACASLHQWVPSLLQKSPAAHERNSPQLCKWDCLLWSTPHSDRWPVWLATFVELLAPQQWALDTGMNRNNIQLTTGILLESFHSHSSGQRCHMNNGSSAGVRQWLLLVDVNECSISHMDHTCRGVAPFPYIWQHCHS